MKKVRAHMRPRIALSPDDARELRALSVDLERELLRAYETFRFRDAGAVDERRWKSVKSHEDVQFFRERSSYKRQAVDAPLPPSPDQHEFAFEIGPQAALAANWKMPLLFGTGTIPGTLDDALFGCTIHDTRSLRARNSYANEVMEENAVLGVVDGPSEDEPFRFLGVLWYLKAYPTLGLMSKRDVLMVASIRETCLSNGERVGIAVYHSIEHRDAPERPDLSVVRAAFSFASLYRQIDPLRLELFFTSIVEPKSSSPEAFVVQDAARSLLTVTNVCEVSFRRKLFHRMRDAQRDRARKDSNAEQLVEVEDDDNCALCNKKTSGLFSASGSTCQICRRRVCSKCSVAKEIVVESTRTSYTLKPFDFCLVCTLETREVPAATVAREELYERALMPRTEQISSTSSASSGSFILDE